MTSKEKQVKKTILLVFKHCGDWRRLKLCKKCWLGICIARFPAYLSWVSSRDLEMREKPGKCHHQFQQSHSIIWRPAQRKGRPFETEKEQVLGELQRGYSNLPNKRIGTISNFFQKLRSKFLFIFFFRENYFYWVSWFLVLLHTKCQVSTKSIKIFFTVKN